MASPITLTELKKNVKEEVYASEQVQNRIKQFQDLLTSSYKTTEQSAATQASYDISNAYYNYLKQQRALAGTSGLETGYKEEIGQSISDTYANVYKQAKAAQQKTLAQTATNVQNQYNQFQYNLEKEVDKLAQIKTDIVDVARQQVEANYNTKNLELYDPETGNLTDWGMDRYMAAILGDSKQFKTAFEEAGKTDALNYLTDETTDLYSLYKELFGFDTLTYNASSEENERRRLGAKGYIESFRPESLTLDRTDFQTFDFFDLGDKGVSKLTDKAEEITKYANSIGLTESEMKDVLGGDPYRVLEKMGKEISESGWLIGMGSKTIGLSNWEHIGSQDTDYLVRQAAIEAYDNLLTALETRAISKYRG